MQKQSLGFLASPRFFALPLIALTIIVALSYTNPPYDNFSGSISINDNTWHHVAVVYDGQTKKVFVDGRSTPRRHST